MSGWISSKLKVAETLLQQIDQQAAESLGKNETSRPGDDLSHSDAAAAIPKKAGDILPPLKDQLKKKKKPEKTNFVVKSQDDVNVNPKSSLTDGDWTELLSAPSKPRVLKDGKRQVRSGSNLLALDRKRSQAKRSNDTVNTDGNSTQAADSLSRKDANVVTNTENKLSVSHLDAPEEQSSAFDSIPDVNTQEQMIFNKTESLSASDMESDSDSSSDSESVRQREEERRKRREQLLAQKAAAKAIEAIKDRENLLARLEGEKESLEKIIDERAKQQAHEASQLQMTMMETLEAVDLEKQKHNNTRMEVLMKLATLETTNAELAKSLAAAQWRLEVEVKRVAELHRQIELKEASHEELTSKKESRSTSGNKLMASRGVEFEHEILEAEHAFVKDKVGQLQEKAKTLEAAIQVTRKEIENPSEVEVELKRRLSQLTDHLIQKQAQVEALSSEKAMLMFRIEAVSRSLDESKSSLKTSDIESGGRWEVRFEEKGQKHMIGSLVRQLDSIFWTFLRRNPMGKIWSIVYLVCLHLWVLYIFRSHTGGSGDVISLENINNTGV